MAALPPAYTFSGTPFCYYYADPKRIAAHMLQHAPFHEETTAGAKLAFAVHIVAYPMTTVAVWVFFAKLVPIYQPHLDKKRKQQLKDKEKADKADEKAQE